MSKLILLPVRRGCIVYLRRVFNEATFLLFSMENDRSPSELATGSVKRTVTWYGFLTVSSSVMHTRLPGLDIMPQPSIIAEIKMVFYSNDMVLSQCSRQVSDVIYRQGC